jgi:hypothetical protein
MNANFFVGFSAAPTVDPIRTMYHRLTVMRPGSSQVEQSLTGAVMGWPPWSRVGPSSRSVPPAASRLVHSSQDSAAAGAPA